MTRITVTGVVGAGAMGQGIAQIVAQAGLDVLLFDAHPQAVVAAQKNLEAIWRRLAEKNKITPEQARGFLTRITPCSDLGMLAKADLIVEAIVERLDIKRSVLADLEDIVSPECILASNTSSLSITAIAQGCQRPERVVGYHFFNPVPLMRVVEVIDGLRTDPLVGDALMELARRMGHTPVRSKDMPGFIVNHAGRGMVVEGLKTVQESVASFDQVDAIMREQAGFRMGPFELMDLTGLDVSHPVMESIYQQFYDEPRFRPSPIAAVRYAGQVLGRKTGVGFYTYDEQGQKIVPEPTAVPEMPTVLHVWVAPYHAVGHRRAATLLNALGVRVAASATPPDDALILITPYGEDVASVVAKHQLDAKRTLGLDTFFGLSPGKRRVLMCSVATQPQWRDAAHALFASDQTPVTVISDSAGFVGQRLVAAIVNTASDIAQQGIATPADIDLAVSLGLGYPYGGPLAMGDVLGASHVLEVLLTMQRVSGDMRYRPSPWLQRRVQLGLSLVAMAACQAG